MRSGGLRASAAAFFSAFRQTPSLLGPVTFILRRAMGERLYILSDGYRLFVDGVLFFRL